MDSLNLPLDGCCDYSANNMGPWLFFECSRGRNGASTIYPCHMYVPAQVRIYELEGELRCKKWGWRVTRARLVCAICGESPWLPFHKETWLIFLLPKGSISPLPLPSSIISFQPQRTFMELSRPWSDSLACLWPQPRLLYLHRRRRSNLCKRATIVLQHCKSTITWSAHALTHIQS